MAQRRKIGAVALLASMVVLTIGVSAAPAGAIVDGPCTGDASFAETAGGPTVASVTADQSLDDVVIVPKKAVVTYNGAIVIDPPSEPISFVGAISAEVAGIGSIEVFDWKGETKEVSISNGTDSYEVPSWVPGGTGTILVTATHLHGEVTCVAQVNVALDGSPGAAAVIAATGTVLFAAGTIGAGFKRKGVA